MALVEVKVPDIGDFKDVEVIELLVKPGDTVAVDQSLLTVESDKASMEIPSSHAGVVKEMKVKLGDKVSEGTLVLMLEAAGAAAAAAAAPAPAAAAAPAPAAAAVAAPRRRRRPPRPARSTCVVPDIGDFDEVAVIEVFVKPGDTVKVEQSLITVESDKASMEIPSSHAGVVSEVKVKLGDKVAKGSLIAVLQGARRRIGGGTGCGRAGRGRRHAGCGRAVGARRARAAHGCAAAARADGAQRRRCRTPRRRSAAWRANWACRWTRSRAAARRAASRRQDVQGFVKGVMAGAVQTAAQKAKAPAAPARPAAAPSRACCRGRRWTSPSSARSSARTCRASRRSAAPTCTATG